MTRVLLTGFGAFEGQSVNASWRAVHGLAESWDAVAEGAELHVRELPVSFRRAPTVLEAALVDVRPDVVVCVGEAGGRGAVGLERVAVNLVDARIADVDGAAPVDVPVVPGAPAAHWATLPVKDCVAAVRAVGVPAEVSLSAGTYVCNATFFTLMHALRSDPSIRAGFVHVPRTPEQVPPGGPGLETRLTVDALRAVLRAATTAVQDLRVSAGTLS
ncbi:pyroglutamyl-peptidase I [Cellulomonas soli]|uniref:Pyroglutamyl-peptidase I n=1 Tax=Cellulomonas soli TaxID=931535 RepID=A0A512PAM4_9CELL|nr:pyroglutamyl-peptidase I [Cellulomonas soli]NYI60739.1 pyroglutamyl-peptidase [Cellulomonas soli]GEP68255.1 pyrrolidone-carboxylate peptidase [Cellulomonas soli]